MCNNLPNKSAGRGTLLNPVSLTDIEEPTASEEWYEEEDRPFEDIPRATSQSRVSRDSQLEKLYDSDTYRIVTQRNDFLIPNLVQSMENDQYINLTPPYQRRLRWDSKRKSRLIESLLMNVPIPPVFLYETDLAQYEVVDGQQRLSTIREFFKNEFPLEGLEIWEGLNGRRFTNLPPRIQSGLNRRSLAAVILLAETERPEAGDGGAAERTDIKRIVFERLNTGGVRLNAQEVRNAVYDGPFNHLLHELARQELFTAIWDIPQKERNEDTKPSQELRSNRLYQQMLDCEIVLRFFALRDATNLRTSMRASLDRTMKRGARLPDQELGEWRQSFLFCLETAHQIFGEKTFRLLPPRRPLSRALYDAVMIGVHEVSYRSGGNVRPDEVRALLVSRKGAITFAVEKLLTDPQHYEVLVGRPNTRKAIVDRIELVTTLLEYATR